MCDKQQRALIDIIRERKSIRKYLNKSVEIEKIRLCLEAARLSPSACNKQPWKFVVIDDRELILRIEKKVFYGRYTFNKHAATAPVLVAVVAERDFLTHRLFSALQGTKYWLLDIGASVEHFILQATELGLGSCWIGWFNQRRLKKILHIPGNKKVVAMISLGYFEEDLLPKEKIRRSLEEIFSFNHY